MFFSLLLRLSAHPLFLLPAMMMMLCYAGSILDEGADWIKSHVDERRVVYVHCKSGIGRSASVVIAFFMKHRHMTAQDAAALVRRMRIEIFKPASAQMASLEEYERAIRGEQKFSAQP